MFRLLLLSGFGFAAVSGQQCCDRRAPECQSLYSTCLSSTNGNFAVCDTTFCNTPPYPIPTICCKSQDSQCQMIYQQCLAGTFGSFSLCQSVFCPDSTSPLPSFTPGPDRPIPSPTDNVLPQVTFTQIPDRVSTLPSFTPGPDRPIPSPTDNVLSCCNPMEESCQKRIFSCMFENLNNNTICNTIACQPSMPPMPSFEGNSSRIECCDGDTIQCREMIQECIQESKNETMCKSFVCPKNTTIPQFTLVPTLRPTPSSYPTRLIRPRLSPMPSRIPLRTILPSNFIIPAKITSRLEFPKADPILIKKPEKLQQLTANIACSLRIPVEKVEIKNISIRMSDGKITGIDFDSSFTKLTNSFSSSCLIVENSDLISSNSLRRELASTDSVIVSYDIIDPPQEIAFADSTTLSAAVNNPSMIAMANSVGATGVLVSSDTSSTTSSSSASTSNNSAIIGGVLGFAFVASIGIAGFSFYQYKKRKARAITQQPHNVVTRVVINPVSSSRAVFGVSQIRV